MDSGEHNVHQLVAKEWIDHCHFQVIVQSCKIKGCDYVTRTSQDRPDAELKLWGRPIECRICHERMEASDQTTSPSPDT